MSQLILNIKDESKLEVLLNFLKSLNYISVEKLNEDALVISDAEKNLMRERKKNAKPSTFKNWEDVKDTFKLD